MSERLQVATRKGLLSYVRNSGGWDIAATDFAGIPVTAVLHDARDSALYTALRHGHFGAKLHRSDDGGKSWTELSAPAFAPGTPDEPSLNQVWTLVAGGLSQPGRLWAGCLPAGLFRSDDRGESWRLVDALWSVPQRKGWVGGGYDDAGIHSVLLDPRDPDALFVAVSVGGVWNSGDGGQSWSLEGEGLIAEYMPPDQIGNREMQDPHRVVRCPAAPDVMWMQHHNGIFRSADAGMTWSRLKPPGDDFGFAVAVHPREPDTAWFVPAIKDEMRIPRDGALAVTRTRDGGCSWQTLRNGLPQRDAYDLIYRHGLDVDESGQRLAIGSTTGALWISEDAGDSWRLVNAHLPPIYAVQFQ